MKAPGVCVQISSISKWDCGNGASGVARWLAADQQFECGAKDPKSPLGLNTDFQGDANDENL